MQNDFLNVTAGCLFAISIVFLSILIGGNAGVLFMFDCMLFSIFLVEFERRKQDARIKERRN